jgi:hypothetical protein
MSIQSDLDELNNINLEIQRLTHMVREFRKQKKNIEDRIISFLKTQETQGVRYNDQAVLLDHRNIRNKKKKTDKVHDLNSVFQKHGIKISEALLSDIFEAQRGVPSNNECLKVVKRNG